MNTTVRGGIILGVLCVIWMYVMGLTGWYLDPALLNLFWVVILIEIGVLVWALRIVSSSGATYGTLVKMGTLMAFLGGVLLFIGSYLFTTVFFPNYFSELRELSGEVMRAQGLSEAEMATRMEAQEAMATPFINALMGFLGTLVTGVLGSVILGLFLRNKKTGTPA